MALYDSSKTNKTGRQNRLYKDIDMDFVRNSVTNDVNTVDNVNAVKRSLRNLILLIIISVFRIRLSGTKKTNIYFNVAKYLLNIYLEISLIIKLFYIMKSFIFNRNLARLALLQRIACRGFKWKLRKI